MHIIIGLITAIAGLLWALNSLQRSGLNLGWLNPVGWNRRRQWRNKYQQIPLYNLKTTMEIAAVTIVGTLKQKGELSREQKHFAIATFQNTFNLNENDATELFGSSSFHLRNVSTEIDEHIMNIVDSQRDEFTDAQIKSLIELVKTASEQEGAATEAQKRTLDNLHTAFDKKPKSHW